ncbi:hypothetical protein C482_09537 [Natrialba chahannaoensis JCM 10990]|uniref:Uncharacterized protein n=1 Tax=Natrialba chahannaoensis JCM 10990 TaxID=1227492 RepID=M0AP45_9EURY|nr:hypothetical protein [Natrialba chahannaoensis]ELY99717.1 hypothetical protein C482_09537 [Natrialba chahannaoensis JCM 10990]
MTGRGDAIGVGMGMGLRTEMMDDRSPAASENVAEPVPTPATTADNTEVT